MRYSVFAGGKRLRPILTLAAAEADRIAPAPRDLALPAACAIEMIHTYSLIHDDLPAMDNDTLRRGRPTLHVVYGDGIAILAGDGLHAEAFTLLAREPARDDRGSLRAQAARRCASSATPPAPMGMVGGQAIDLQAAGQAPGHALDARRRRPARDARAQDRRVDPRVGRERRDHGRRDRPRSRRSTPTRPTSAWRFRSSTTSSTSKAMPASLGKTAGKDAAGGKPTYPALFGLERSRALAAECLARAHASLAAAGVARPARRDRRVGGRAAELTRPVPQPIVKR